MIKKWNQKNMKECDKRKSSISTKLRMIYTSYNNVGHPVTKTLQDLKSSSTLFCTGVNCGLSF